MITIDQLRKQSAQYAAKILATNMEVGNTERQLGHLKQELHELQGALAATESFIQLAAQTPPAPPPAAEQTRVADPASV